MIAMPAVDLRDGACVQLVGGEYADERVRLSDPVAVAVAWAGLGFRALHVVDLDAATGRGRNDAIVAAIISAAGVPVQAGGGVRDENAIEQVLALGADRVVIGTRALDDPEWLERVAWHFPRRLVVAADVRGREVLTHGWTRALADDFDEVLGRLAALPLAGVLVTAVHQEGRLAGPDLALTRRAVALAGHPVQASGGIAGIRDLEDLARAGAAAAVIGMALYTGAIDPVAAARDFSNGSTSLSTRGHDAGADA